MLFSMQSPMLVRGNQAPIAYRSQAITVAGATTLITKPAGVAVGDLVIVFDSNPFDVDTGPVVLATTGGDAWAAINIVVGNSYRIWWKFMIAIDVANSWNTDNNHASGVFAIAWEGKGASSLTAISSVVGGVSPGPTLDLGSYSNTESKGAITYLRAANTLDMATPPQAFTERGPFDVFGAHAFVADALGTYIPGAPVIWTTGYGGIGVSPGAILWDVT